MARRVDKGKIKATSLRPGKDQECVDSTGADYINQVNEILKNDSGALDPNSDLYKNALDQLNESITKGSTERLEIPKGFCGYRNPTTGRFDVIDEENYLRFSGGVPLTTTAPSGTLTTVGGLSSYDVDTCLEFGLPGSVDYMNCKLGDDNKDIEEEARVTAPGLSPEMYKKWDDVYKAKLWLAMLDNEKDSYRINANCVTNKIVEARGKQAQLWVDDGDWAAGAAAFKAWEDSVQNCCNKNIHVMMAPTPVEENSDSPCDTGGGGGLVGGEGKPYYKKITVSGSTLTPGTEVSIGVQIVARTSIDTSAGNPYIVADAGSAILRYHNSSGWKEDYIAQGILGSTYNASRLYIPHIEIAGGVGWVSCKMGIKEWGSAESYGAGLWRFGTISNWGSETFKCHSQPYKNIGGIFIKGYGNVSIDTTDSNSAIILGNEGQGGTNGAWARYTNAGLPATPAAKGTLGDVTYRSGEKSRFRVSFTGRYHAAMNGFQPNPSTYAYSDDGVTWSGFNWASYNIFPEQGDDLHHPDIGVDGEDGKICYMGAYFDGGLYINVYNNGLKFDNECSLIDSGATKFSRFGPQWASKGSGIKGAYLCWTRGADVIIADVNQNGKVLFETIVAQGKHASIAVDSGGDIHLAYVRPD